MKSINEILALGDVSIIKTLITSHKRPFNKSILQIENEWNPQMHKIFDEQHRPKKIIQVPTGKTDPSTGKPLYRNKRVERVRIAIPFQKSITNIACGFLFGIPVTYNNKGKQEKQQKRLFDAVMRVFHMNKMKYFDKRLARTVSRYMEAAELWYMDTSPDGHINKQGKVRVRLLSPGNGDELYPHYNDSGDMDGFARKYKVYDELGVGVEHFDVYTSNYVYSYILNGQIWQMNISPKLHGFTKIPIVYYRTEQTEWDDVQPSIERAEELVSNWGDTNDYVGMPKFFVKGNLKGFAEKGEQGSVFQGGENTDMRILSWDNSPTSVSGELSTLFSIIYSFTHSADISFDHMRQIGNNTSGAAIRLMFTDPHMNAQNKTELYGEMFTRRCNIVANGICNTGIVDAGIPMSTADDIEFDPVFTPYMPKNEVEEIEIISKSVGGLSTTSRRRGIELNPINSNPDEVEKQINQEEKIALSNNAILMGAGGISNDGL